MWNYAGGWQELFPSVNAACNYRGREIPFHGEVASLPWEHEVLDGEGSVCRVRFSDPIAPDAVPPRARPQPPRR